MFQNIYEGKKIIVTGHTGFKGSWLSLWLKLMKAEVYGISIDIPTKPSLFETANIHSQIESHIEDIRNLDAVKKMFTDVQPDFVFHLAAQPIVKRAYENPVECMTTNVIGTVNILESLRSLQNQCIAVMITSDKCYDNVEWIWGYRETDHLGGKDPYSASKGAAELMIKTYYHSYFSKNSLIKISSVRAGNVIGGGDWAANRIVPDCFNAWSNNKRVVIRNPSATRPWQHVLEPLSGYLRTGELLALPEKNSINGEAFNFGPSADQNYSVIDLIGKLAEQWDPNNKDILETESSDFHEAGLLKLNIDKALHYLGWQPTLNFSETATYTSDWYKEFYQANQKGMLQFTNNQIEMYAQQAKSNNAVWCR
jgi:CDP-glucose 4,6-dehydratase